VRPVSIGASGRFEIVPDDSHTAAAIGNTGVAVVATPALVGFVEQASHFAIRSAFDTGEASVGTRLEINHLAPAFPGRRVLAMATVAGVERRSVRFEVGVEQDGRAIMRGRHDRVVVDLASFLAKQPAPASAAEAHATATARTVTFWFDFHSPWCYLASTRVSAIAAQHDATVRWRPLQLARLIEAVDGRRALDENPAFVRWYMQDLQDWAALYVLKIEYHPHFPLRPSRALRAALHAAEAGRAEAWVLRVMRAYWSEAADISDLEVLGRLAGDVGLDPAGTVEAAVSDARKATLEANTREAIEAGVFGVPSFVVDGKLFFGNDRLLMLDRHLGGDSLDRFAAGLV
jgi:2-hydroxychromene-2-carboxylate isomerase/predicted thioesterase